VSPSVQGAIHEIEDLAMAAQADQAIEAARATASKLPDGVQGDDDRIAVGEVVAFVAAAAGAGPAGWALLDDLARQSVSHVARGALYFHRGRQVMEVDAAELLRLALGEFTRAGHARGRAVTLAAMCWPTKGAGSPEHRLRLGRQALELALTLDDAWAVAYCAGRLAGAEIYQGDRAGLEHYALAAQALVADPNPQSAAVASLNQLNWGLDAFGYGDYADARRILGEGRVVALGEEWRHWFDGAIALVDWRTGALRTVPSAEVVDDWGALGSIVAAAVELETARKPATTHADAAADTVQRRSQQLKWLALAIQARLRVVRNEPAPLRGLGDFTDEAAQAEIRCGWEDAAMVLAEHEPATAGVLLRKLDDLWADHPRALACRAVVDSLLDKRDRFGGLVEAADVFAGLPEPVTAGRTLHLAASVAPSVTEGNHLRRRAVDLLRQAGADRSLAAVLRDRTLHRGSSHEAIPDQLKGVVTGALTRREREVAVLAAKGLTAQEIATELSISVWTARHHVQRVREKLGGVPKRKLGQLLAEPDSFL